MGPTILLTGATGYVGGRLLPALVASGARVRCLVRNEARFEAPAGVEVVEGDCLAPDTLAPALQGVDAAYYLVHSMSAGGDFESLDRLAAAHFGAAAARAGARRIVYLGGLGDPEDDLSPHLSSRHETGRALAEGGVPVVELRASIVIGSGSLSFEMVRALADRLPVMICPRWVGVLTQPIAAADVVAYLVAALDLPRGAEGVYEIGGPDVVSYGDILREYARQRGLRRVLISVPLLTPRLSSLWLALVTPLQARVGRKLIDGVRNATVVRSDRAARAFSVRAVGLQAAVAAAIAEGGRAGRRFVDDRTIEVGAPAGAVFDVVRGIGGDRGWYFGDGLWRLRGLLDRAVGGPGMGQGRRDPDDCRVGDIIDGWRVEAVAPGRRLRLRARMKMPGRAWLSFEVESRQGGSRLRQTAEFEPRGLAGRLYWYALLPVHAVMFAGLIRAIARRARLRSARA